MFNSQPKLARYFDKATRLARLCLTLSLLTVALIPAGNSRAAVSGFVTRSGSNLMLNGQPFRFSGTNIYWLGLDENVPPNTVDWPTSFRVDDALATAKEMGATVVRAHTLGFSTGCSKCIEPSLGTFNEAALVKVDYAIKVAGDNGLRLILPLTDNYAYYHGGYHNFTDWRGLASSQFWTNATVISDFEQFISHMLNRVNTYTGVAYKNDPTILAWETGNELSNPPTSWTTTIANYIKSIDTNHLVVDGNYGINTSALSITNVDIYSDHYYPMDTTKLSNDLSKMSGSNKVYYIGEYNWTGANLSTFLSTIRGNSAVAGDSFWSLFPHNDNYGYVQHNDCCTLHYPGDSSSMRTAAQSLRSHAYAIRGMSVPADGIPTAPLVTNTNNPITWRGAVSGNTYTIERSTDQVNWTVICNKCATDNNTPWNDSTRPAGTVYYRIQAFNLSGVGGPYSNNPPGPTATPTRTNTPVASATPTATPSGTITVDDSVQGTGQNQFNYVGTGWNHCTNCNEGGAAIFYNASQSWNTTTNSYVTIAFTGTQIKYYAVKAPDVGIAAVSIDGGTETNIDLYMTPKTGNVLVWTSATLSAGSHTFKVRNTGTKNASSSGTTITLDRVDILSGPTPTPGPTNTPTNTPTRTNTPLPPTATATPSSSGNTHSGTWALKSVFTSTASWKNAQEQPAVSSNQTFVASVWIKGVGAVQLQVMNGNWGTAIVTVRCNATSSWTQCSSGSFSTGTNTQLTYAFRDAYGVASTLYLDDAFLGVSGGTNVLSNAGFESGNVNWILDTGGQYTILQP